MTLAPTQPLDAAAPLLSELRLLEPDSDSVVRLPLLLRGELVVPPELDADALRAALADRDYATVGDAQVLRRELLDPETLRPAGGDLLFVVPRVADPRELVVDDAAAVARDLYGLPLARALELVDAARGALAPGGALFARTAALVAATSSAPAAFVAAALAQAGKGLDAQSLRAQVDFELAHGDRRGSALLDGWRQVAAAAQPGPASGLAHGVDGQPRARPGARFVRALPTRQLHVTAGNSPTVPLLSLFRALAVKSPVVLKAAADALPTASALAVALALAGRGHPLARYVSIAYWPGGDERVEGPLLAAGAFDRIVVWGDQAAVAAVRGRAALTKTIAFNPRYAISLVGRDALAADFDRAVAATARDAVVWSQRACNASLVAYVEGSADDARRFAAALAGALAAWDERHPSPLTSAELARLRAARRGALAGGEWVANGDPRAPSSAAVYMPRTFDLAAHPMTRVVVVRELERADDAVALVRPATSQVGVAPDALRLRLRDALCARGASAVLPLGEADSAFAGMPHDSLRPLAELVAWSVS